MRDLYVEPRDSEEKSRTVKRLLGSVVVYIPATPHADEAVEDMVLEISGAALRRRTALHSR